ncbi:lipopolysaccharide biosynthesis protein [Prevotella sp. 10(H)]|uniref:lipopolysaccharide biosynthesis protein n=1 Tax=Prevotella sp. 10(H) TaxID=1158294 RepID=UPI0004A74AFB|nr:lipopolysaccharide biosynthesis protein [Prevotella sp. 10(H)]
MADSLKKKTGLALFWSFIDKGGQQVISLLFFYILVRLISKEDIGTVNLLAIFTIISGLLQDSGFSSALVRKKEVHPDEYTSVFYINITISFILYFILFICAPFIGSFYDKPVLTDLSRFIFLGFVFNAFAVVQNVNLIREMNFKLNTRITLFAWCISGLIAIYMAYNGYGIWSMAAQQVIQSFLRCLLLWLFVRWRPNGHFSFQRIKEMSRYSINLLLSSLFGQICNNISPLIIGKKFSLSQVATYTQGLKLTNIPQSVISDGMKSVAYPLLSKIGEDKERGKRAYRKVIRITSFISFPVAAMLIVTANPIVSIYLTEEWTDVIPILQILAVGGSFLPFFGLISSLLQYEGRSGMLLKIEACKNILILVAIAIGIQFGIQGLVAGLSIVNVLSYFISMYIAGKNISYSFREILKDTAPYIVIAIASFSPFFLLYKAGIDNVFLRLAIPVLAGSGIYLLIMRMFGSVILRETIDFVKQSLRKLNI